MEGEAQQPLLTAEAHTVGDGQERLGLQRAISPDGPDAAGLLDGVERPATAAVAGHEDGRGEAIGEGFQGDRDLGGLEDRRRRRLTESRHRQRHRPGQCTAADDQCGKAVRPAGRPGRPNRARRPTPPRRPLGRDPLGCTTWVASVRESEGGLRVTPSSANAAATAVAGSWPQRASSAITAAATCSASTSKKRRRFSRVSLRPKPSVPRLRHEPPGSSATRGPARLGSSR